MLAYIVRLLGMLSLLFSASVALKLGAGFAESGTMWVDFRMDVRLKVFALTIFLAISNAVRGTSHLDLCRSTKVKNI